MKTKFLQLAFLFLVFTLASCGSGHNAPADSHPGSGSVKAGPQNEDKKSADSVKKDSAKKETP